MKENNLKNRLQKNIDTKTCKKINQFSMMQTQHNNLITFGREKFKIDIFLVILDRLLNKLFSFVVMHDSLSHEDIIILLQKLHINTSL